MADPIWTANYSLAQTPEQNGFTRTLYGEPIVTLTTSGPTANRKVVVDSTSGDCVFTTSQVPTLDSTVGATLEFITSQNGGGDVGCELTFVNKAFGVEVYDNNVIARICQDAAPGELTVDVPTSGNGSDTTWRVTIDDSAQFRLYRNTALTIGPTGIPECIKPFQRVLWWKEGGGTGIFKKMAYYLGGAVAP